MLGPHLQLCHISDRPWRDAVCKCHSPPPWQPFSMLCDHQSPGKCYSRCNPTDSVLTKQGFKGLWFLFWIYKSHHGSGSLFIRVTYSLGISININSSGDQDPLAGYSSLLKCSLSIQENISKGRDIRIHVGLTPQGCPQSPCIWMVKGSWFGCFLGNPVWDTLKFLMGFLYTGQSRELETHFRTISTLKAATLPPTSNISRSVIRSRYKISPFLLCFPSNPHLIRMFALLS